jgi:peptidyl-prolyl cis-trans isomerase SurA
MTSFPISCHPPSIRPGVAAYGRRGAAACVLVLAGLAPALAPAQVPAQAAAQPAAAAAARTNRSGDFIVAVVNTELVTAVELNQRMAQAMAELKRGGGAPPAPELLRQQVLDALIDERVLVTHARDAGYKIDDTEIDRAVANVAAQNQLTVAQLRERLASEGMDFRRFRNNLRDQMLVDRVREREVIGRIRVADDEVDRLLDQQRAQLAAEPQLNLAQVLVTVPEGASAELVAERQARAATALARLRAGDDFAKVAREFSEDANREAGGEIGLRPASRLPDLFVAAVKDLAAGEVTPAPVRSGAGFHLLKVVDRQQAGELNVTQTRARHILLRVPEGSRPEALVRRLEDLRRQIERGEKSFEDMARSVSEDASGQAGGDLGWAGPGQFVPEFEEAINKLPVGGLSPPVVSRFGVHLIQVQERRTVAIDPKALREQARNQLREQKFEPAYLDWVKELRLRAYVELREPPL